MASLPATSGKRSGLACAFPPTAGTSLGVCYYYWNYSGGPSYDICLVAALRVAPSFFPPVEPTFPLTYSVPRWKGTSCTRVALLTSSAAASRSGLYRQPLSTVPCCFYLAPGGATEGSGRPVFSSTATSSHAPSHPSVSTEPPAAAGSSTPFAPLPTPAYYPSSSAPCPGGPLLAVPAIAPPGTAADAWPPKGPSGPPPAAGGAAGGAAGVSSAPTPFLTQSSSPNWSHPSAGLLSATSAVLPSPTCAPNVLLRGVAAVSCST